MAIEKNNTGLGVKTPYGPRSTDEGRVGHLQGFGAEKELVLQFRPEYASLVDAVLPKGAIVKEAFATVKEALVTTGAATKMVIGTDGSAATNGISFTKAQVEAAGTYKSAAATGTWVNPLAAVTKIQVGVDAGTLGAVGDIVVVIRYVVTGK